MSIKPKNAKKSPPDSRERTTTGRNIGCALAPRKPFGHAVQVSAVGVCIPFHFRARRLRRGGMNIRQGYGLSAAEIVFEQLQVTDIIPLA